jgi:hypothetical protein
LAVHFDEGALMADWGYDDNWGAGSYDDWSGYGGNVGAQSSPDFYSSPAYQAFTGWGDPTGPGSSGDTSGGGWWGNIGGILGGVGSFLGQNAGTLGPLASTLGGVASGAIGSNAAGNASAQQAEALNRGIDLQTAQWLQQQQAQAPWLQAGQQALGHLTGRMDWAGPAQPGATSAISGANYQLPGTTPGWTPQAYQGPAGVNAGDYRWTPGQGPSAATYRYTPGQTPDAAMYASGAPQLYQGAMPGTQVSTLTGQQVLDQDPGAAFRQSEARKALEGSAAARGDLLSGGTLQALQARSQDLASQEYGNAWQRMMARDTEQYGRNWGQYQQAWNQGVQGTQLGLQTTAQNFGQALSASQLREQVNQQASQQGWSQAQAEAAFREQMAAQAQAQNFQSALAGQGQQYAQGLQSAQWNQGQQQQFTQEHYQRMMADAQARYGWDVNQNQTDYQRQQQAYQNQQAALQREWGNFAQVAGLGQAATGQAGVLGANYANQAANLYGQVGSANALGTIGQAGQWQGGVNSILGAGNTLLKNLNA